MIGGCMYKKDLVNKTLQILKSNNIKKPVQIKKNVFHISDSEGNSANFTVKQQEKMVIYTVDDVNNILDALLLAVENGIKSGEGVTLRGFGTLSLVYRPPKMMKKLGENEFTETSGKYVPKIQFGNTLKMAARIYELKMKDTNTSEMISEDMKEDEEIYGG